MNEKAFSKIVMDYLKNIPGLYPIRIQPGPYGGMKGVSDILCCCKGCFIAIELKVGHNQASKLQSRFLRKIQEAGGTGTVCRSLDEVKNVIT